MLTLLDIGGGNQPHIEEGYKTIATDRHDFSTDYVGKENCKFICHDVLTQLPFKNGSIDKIWCHHVLEHLPHQLPDGRDALVFVISEIARVLKKNCEAHLIVPWMNHPNGTRHPCHYRFFDTEIFNWFDYRYDSPDLEAYGMPRTVKVTMNKVQDNCHIYAILEKI